MSGLLEKFNAKQILQLREKATLRLPNFQPGDTVKVGVNVFDGAGWRLQHFEGVCIKKRNRGLHSSFTLRKVSQNESIQLQVFAHSPNLKTLDVVRAGRVRRAKLYYLLPLFGKAARIKERKRVLQSTH